MAKGKGFESKIEDYFNKEAPKKNVFFHRLPDSYNARGRATIPGQPADYEFVIPGGILFYVEAKEVNKDFEHRWALWKLTDEQYATYEKSITYGFNYLCLTWHRGPDMVYLTPSWLLWEKQQELGKKVIDLKELSEDYPFIVLNSNEELLDKLIDNKKFRNEVL